MSQDPGYKARFAGITDAYAGPMQRLCAAYAFASADRDDLFQEFSWRYGEPSRHFVEIRANARGSIESLITSR